MFDVVTQERKDQRLTFEDLVVAKVSSWFSSSFFVGVVSKLGHFYRGVMYPIYVGLVFNVAGYLWERDKRWNWRIHLSLIRCIRR